MQINWLVSIWRGTLVVNRWNQLNVIILQSIDKSFRKFFSLGRDVFKTLSNIYDWPFNNFREIVRNLVLQKLHHRCFWHGLWYFLLLRLNIRHAIETYLYFSQCVDLGVNLFLLDIRFIMLIVLKCWGVYFSNSCNVWFWIFKPDLRSSKKF